MCITDPVEGVYLLLMIRWQRHAPPDGHQGLLDGEPERNTQISRMVYVLQKIAIGHGDQVYQALAKHTRRDDGNSYISKDPSWMIEPRSLDEGWFFEGCTSLIQKQWILQQLTRVGLSHTFINCADDFVANNSVEKYFPSPEEAEEIVSRLREKDDSLKMY